MSTLVRQADPAKDRNGILAVLERNLNQAVRPGRFEWAYLRNPLGPSLVWVLEEVGSGQIVGTSAAHRRRIRIDGEAVEALNLGDFAIDVAFRSLGPALKLLKATLGPVRDGTFALSYDHPNKVMASVYRRIGGTSLGSMQRLVRPVRLDGYFSRGIGLRALAIPVAKLANAALRVSDRVTRPRNLRATREHGSNYGHMFTELDATLGTGEGVIGVRDGPYLEWRFGQHPIWNHRCLEILDGSKLAGFAIFRPLGASLKVVEMQASDDALVRESLLYGLLRLARTLRCDSLAVQVLEGTPTARAFSRLGFRKRQTGGEVFFYGKSGTDLAGRIADAGRWWMIEGDRDV